MFQNASYIRVGHITQVNARAIHRHEHHHYGRGDPTMKDLYAHIAPAAMHNSAARANAPKCHEETRKAVQEEMASWTSDNPEAVAVEPKEANEILWLTGPAGTGKTAIMGTVSDTLDESGRLAATFYFSSVSGTAETMSKRRFVTTLAYQLAVHPSLKDEISLPILTAIQENPAILEMTLKSQLDVLILRPLRHLRDCGSLAPLPRLCILVDGVDECGEAGTMDPVRSRQSDQIEVLSVLLQAVNDPAFPFRIIVASRPETWIRACFDNAPATTVVEMFLDEKYGPDDDIRLYMRSKFAQIARRHRRDPSEWPSSTAIDKLVENASGQFIYASTVIRFIDTPGTNPQAQLDIVLSIAPTDKSNPFAALDALYTSIIRAGPVP